MSWGKRFPRRALPNDFFGLQRREAGRLLSESAKALLMEDQYELTREVHHASADASRSR